MTKTLTVKDEIFIKAAPAKVWKVLVSPKYVAEWDELPENYPPEDMMLGSEVVWEHPNGEKTITTVIKAIEEKELIIALFSSNWEDPPEEGDVAYHYKIEKQEQGTLLKIEIGDFTLIKHGQDYYDASVDFASTSKEIIKQLAENLMNT